MIELDQNISGTYINKLCQLQDGSPQLLWYQAAKPLDPFIDHFDIMLHKSSILFLDPLNDRLKKVLTTKSNLTIAHIYLDIWQPVFDHCRSLLESLIDQSMKLSFIDKHLRAYKQNLNNVVMNLAVGLSQSSGVAFNASTFQNALWKVKQYWKLCQYQSGAYEFLQLRSILCLDGDFRVIEALSVQVSDA